MSVYTDKIFSTLQKNVKILLIVIAALVVTIVLLILFRPKETIPNSVYQSRIDSLSHEVYVLQEMKKIQEKAISEKDLNISLLNSRDSILFLKYSQQGDQLKNLKTTYDKKRSNIDRYGSADIKRAFSELTDDE